MTQLLAFLRQLCLKVSQCVAKYHLNVSESVSKCLNVSQCISSCLKLFQVVSKSLKVSQHVSMCLKVYQAGGHYIERQQSTKQWQWQ
jgi:hypothetical protein